MRNICDFPFFGGMNFSILSVNNIAPTLSLLEMAEKESTALIYPETSEGAHAYAIGSHRHGPEIDEKLSAAIGRNITVSFTPHLIL